jgi:XTP/dITP diphosphohydrolase
MAVKDYADSVRKKVKMQLNLQGKLLLATRNIGKIVELRQLLADLENVRLLTPTDIGLAIEVEETGHSYAENAAIKAEAYVHASGLITLADDSGLEVDALAGAPGIHSARYTSLPGSTDADRRQYLLANLVGLPRPWVARFRAWVVLAVPGESPLYTEGVCEGEIIPEERGSNGFGYDPIFYIADMGRTMAELTDEEKNEISHRGNAVRAVIPMLQDVFRKV